MSNPRTIADAPEQADESERQIAFEQREAEARARGWVGTWPPEKPHIESPADCEHYLTRLEDGEERAGFLAALSTSLVKFFEELQSDHFRRFGAILLQVAENPKATSRTRLRAVQAAIRPMRQAIAILPKLSRASDGSRQGHLIALLSAFFDELGHDRLQRLARVLVNLAERDAKSLSDRVRTVEAALKIVTDTMEMLVEVRKMYVPGPDMNDPELQRKLEEARREMAEMIAEIDADDEEERRTGKPIRRDWQGRQVDEDYRIPGPSAS